MSLPRGARFRQRPADERDGRQRLDPSRGRSTTEPTRRGKDVNRSTIAGVTICRDLARPSSGALEALHDLRRTAMRPNRTVVCAALAASLAFVASAPVDAQRWGGGGGRPSAGKPSTGGGQHWRGGGNWSGRHHGHHGHRHFGHWPVWGLGIGIGIGAPYVWGWDYYPHGVPVAIVDRPVYVNPEPMPAYGDHAFRWYCPASGGYYPDVRECARPWLKVVPSERGPAPPPLSDSSPADDPAAPSTPSAPAAPRSSQPAPGPVGAAGNVRIAAPRMAPPTKVASRRAAPQALAQGEIR
jgi:hypothetical protein